MNLTNNPFSITPAGVIENGLLVKFIENQITVTGNYLDGSTTKSISQEFSDDGNDLDGDTSGDKTKVYITSRNNLNIVKRARFTIFKLFRLVM